MSLFDDLPDGVDASTIPDDVKIALEKKFDDKEAEAKATIELAAAAEADKLAAEKARDAARRAQDLLKKALEEKTATQPTEKKAIAVRGGKFVEVEK